MAKKKYTYWRMLAAVGLVVALAYGCAGSESAVDNSGELSSKEGKIAFMHTTSFEGTDIESDIYSINVEGTRDRRLTDTPGLDGFPSWSPDGQRLLFATDRAGGGNWELYVMNSDGTEQQRLTNTSEKDEGVPAWSPDGEKIAYVTDPINNPQIHPMNADGTGREWLVAGNWPTWAPDGERIAITVYPGGAEQLAVINADGTDEHRLTGRFLATGR
jgi:Tol biopolymer transport system component